MSAQAKKQMTIEGGRGPWTKAEIVELLESSDKAVERAIVALYKRQTNRERSSMVSIVKNGAGFSSHDAKYFSKLARMLQHKNNHLFPNVIRTARPRIMKYVGQLRYIANGKLSETNC